MSKRGVISLRSGDTAILASEADDGTGVIVSVVDPYSTERLFFGYKGGSWELRPNGTLGSQQRGTSDVIIPRDRKRWRWFLGRLFVDGVAP